MSLCLRLHAERRTDMPSISNFLQVNWPSTTAITMLSCTAMTDRSTTNTSPGHIPAPSMESPPARQRNVAAGRRMAIESRDGCGSLNSSAGEGKPHEITGSAAMGLGALCGGGGLDVHGFTCAVWIYSIHNTPQNRSRTDRPAATRKRGRTQAMRPNPLRRMCSKFCTPEQDSHRTERQQWAQALT